MSNLFNSDNFATVEPEVLTIGDRWVWKRTDLVIDYPPSSYALSYNARLQGAGSNVISITVIDIAAEFDPKSVGPEPYEDIILYWNYYLDFLDDDSFKFFQKSFQSEDSCGKLFLLFFIVFIFF